MKNNHGFTLVELLAIIVILGIIMALAAPSMTKQISEKEKTDQTILDEKIHNASKLYAAKYYSDKIVDKPNCNYTTNEYDIKFSLNDLEQDGLINLKDKCASEMEDDIYVCYDFTTAKIKYDYDRIKNADCASAKISE